MELWVLGGYVFVVVFRVLLSALSGRVPDYTCYCICSALRIFQMVRFGYFPVANDVSYSASLIADVALVAVCILLTCHDLLLAVNFVDYTAYASVSVLEF